MTVTSFSTATGRADHPHPDRRRVLWVACGAHALHDGLTDTLYLLLPLWQAQFALSYAAIGMLRALYAGVMAGFQVPAAKVAQRTGGAKMLAGGTAVAAVAYFLLGASSSVALLAVALVLGGIGSSTQHPIASSLVAAAYEGPRSRGALGTYNFAGDLGKMALPSITACLIGVISWRWTGTAVGVIGLLGAGAILLSLRAVPSAIAVRAPIRPEQGKAPDWTKLLRNGFPLLLTIGVIDSATRMGFLTFLPFLLQSKGAGLSEIGVAFAVEEAQGANRDVEAGPRGAGRYEVNLIGPHLRQPQPIRRSIEVLSEFRHRMHIASLRRRRQVADLHVLYHTTTQWVHFGHSGISWFRFELRQLQSCQVGGDPWPNT
jgi:MFS transporter, FSR family, fosmidomycin resistance protein